MQPTGGNCISTLRTTMTSLQRTDATVSIPCGDRVKLTWKPWKVQGDPSGVRSGLCKYISVGSALSSADEVDGCPVPDKSARCQSIRPVRMSLPAIRSELPPVWRRRSRPTPSHAAPTRSSVRASERDLAAGPATIGPDRPARRSLERGRRQSWATNGTLIVCRSIRPAQVTATMPGRLIWRGTTGQQADDLEHGMRIGAM